MGIIQIILLILAPSILFAECESFNNYFNLVQDSRGVREVRLNVDGAYFDPSRFQKYAEKLVSHLKLELSQKGANYRRLDEIYSDLVIFDKDDAKRVALFEEALAVAQKLDLESLGSSKEFNKVMTNYSKVYVAQIKKMSPALIANLIGGNPYFRKPATQKAVIKILKEANHRLRGEEKAWATYIIIASDELVKRSLYFHQNMLLGFINGCSPQSLGLSSREVEKIKVSIVESRVWWWDIEALGQIKQDAHEFMRETLRSLAEIDTKRLENYSSKNKSKEIELLLPGFIKVTKKDDEAAGVSKGQVYLLREPKSCLNDSLSLALDFDQPHRIAGKRNILWLTDLGLSFTPFPSWDRDGTAVYLDSFYKDQQVLEGSFLSYFLINGDQKHAKEIRDQALNPYITQL